MHEFFLPLNVEVLEQIVSNVYILFHLVSLDVRPKLILVVDNLELKKSDFFHQVFVELVFVDLDAFFSEQLHLLFSTLEDHNLFIFVQHTVTTSIEHIKELSWIGYPQYVHNVITALLEH